ncbi:alpha/beta hydrolase family protein [Chitinophaga filiformis]|uniref:Prolyl oligopeptidase family serine peptidase n=1 Tax=Chitinophaga filiformis TaxID=104663 RepID=A0ABY4I6T5_CHIFI|nr:prolyl oligopeptidase family serine peptidase [Chitinophaga filiformis]UPK71797.1 prolyl oligopeptidase family serine peptidase [Chitinophaga filiformis]
MNKVLKTLVFFLLFHNCIIFQIFSQDKAIDIDFLKHQDSHETDFQISNSKEFYAVVHRGENIADSIEVRTIDGKRILKLLPEDLVTSGRFSQNGEWYIYTSSNGNNGYYNLKEKKINVISGETCRFIDGDKKTYALYRLDTNWYLKCLEDRRTIQVAIKRAEDLIIAGHMILCLNADSIVTVNLEKYERKVIKKIGIDISAVIIDNNAQRVAFAGRQSLNKQIIDGLYYFTIGDTELIAGPFVKRDQQQEKEESKAVVPVSFAKKGEVLIYKVRSKMDMRYSDSSYSVKVDIWNYKDPVSLSSKSSMEDNSYEEHFEGIKLTTGDTFQVSRPGEMVIGKTDNNNYCILENSYRKYDHFWRKDSWQTVTIANIGDSSRKVIINKTNDNITDIKLSPNEKFVIWFNNTDKQYYCYNIAREQTSCITDKLPVAIYEKADFIASMKPYGVAGWSDGDSSILINDENDIWIIDVLGSKSRRITSGMGRKKGLMFRLMPSHAFETDLLVQRNDVIRLVVYDKTTKRNGFAYINSLNDSVPHLLAMEDALFYFPKLYYGNGSIDMGGIPPTRLADGDFLVRRQTVESGISYCLTKDFRHFTEVWRDSPPVGYVWMKTELHTWKNSKGDLLQGILYKPSNFDARKKYPVIFDYYEKRSDELHHFMKPRFSTCRIDIPYYVSNGYLIFVPDIIYKAGETCQSATDCVVSAARYLSTFDWIDTMKLGLQGHSFGGYQTNCIITHSNLFAAACEASGASNLTSANGELFGVNYQGGARHFVYEEYQGNLRSPMFENPDLYIKNSPVFFVKNVSTPLLIMHNKDDGAVLFSQAVEMYLGLYRAMKPVWLLQYDGHGHGTWGEASVDFTIRMKQFFDHYLKGEKAPVWMSKGVPYYLRSKYSGLDLEDIPIEE